MDPENRFTPEEAWDLDTIASRIAKQKHNFDGVKTQIYHGLSRGWFINEILRRVHPQHYSARDILNKEILPLLSPDNPRACPVYASVP